MQQESYGSGEVEKETQVQVITFFFSNEESNLLNYLLFELYWTDPGLTEISIEASEISINGFNCKTHTKIKIFKTMKRLRRKYKANQKVLALQISQIGNNKTTYQPLRVFLSLHFYQGTKKSLRQQLLLKTNYLQINPR